MLKIPEKDGFFAGASAKAAAFNTSLRLGPRAKTENAATARRQASRLNWPPWMLDLTVKVLGSTASGLERSGGLEEEERVMMAMEGERTRPWRGREDMVALGWSFFIGFYEFVSYFNFVLV